MDRWTALIDEIGFNNARIVAHAISWAFRPDNWRFLPWYWKLKQDIRDIVDRYFDEYLETEMKERSINHSVDLSLLINRFNLPPIERIYKSKLVIPKDTYVKELIANGTYDPDWRSKQKLLKKRKRKS